MAGAAASVLPLLCVVTMLAGAVMADAQYSAQTFVDLQNAARADVGVAPLAWDDTLAAYAQRYAGERKGDCALEHSGGPYGENIFWGSKGSNWTAGDAVATWVQEKQSYNCSDGSCAAGRVCAHYTQIVWASTTLVGCAAVDCDGNRGRFILCEYDPRGNLPGVRRLRPVQSLSAELTTGIPQPPERAWACSRGTARWRPTPKATRTRGRATAGKSLQAGHTARTSSKAAVTSAGPSPTRSSPGSERSSTMTAQATCAGRGRPAGSTPSSSGPTQPELAAPAKVGARSSPATTTPLAISPASVPMWAAPARRQLLTKETVPRTRTMPIAQVQTAATQAEMAVALQSCQLSFQL